MNTTVYAEFGSLFFLGFPRLLRRPELHIDALVVSDFSYQRLMRFYEEPLAHRLRRWYKLVRYADAQRLGVYRWLHANRHRVQRFDPTQPPARHTEYLASLGFMRRIPPDHLPQTERSTNLHWSLLPDYAGCHPLYWALREHRERVGVTLHRLAPAFDAGPVLLQASIATTPRQTAADLRPAMARLSRKLIDRYLDHPQAADERATPQDPTRYRFFRSPRIDQFEIAERFEPRENWGRYRAADPGQCWARSPGRHRARAVTDLRPHRHRGYIPLGGHYVRLGHPVDIPPSALQPQPHPARIAA